MMTTEKRPRKLTERQIEKILAEYGFERRAHEILRQLAAAGVAWQRPEDASQRDGEFYSPAASRDWVIATRAGFLGVSVHDDWIACVFDDAEAGRDHVDASVPSGKWNHHAFVHAIHGRTERREVIDRLGGTLYGFVGKIAGLTDVDSGPLFEVLVGDPPIK